MSRPTKTPSFAWIQPYEESLPNLWGRIENDLLHLLHQQPPQHDPNILEQIHSFLSWLETRWKNPIHKSLDLILTKDIGSVNTWGILNVIEELGVATPSQAGLTL